MKSRIKELDALRGIASLAVVIHHYSGNKQIALFSFKYGAMGVELFFIISGFVIFMTIENSKKWQDFVISRFSRLYPTFWTCLLITTILVLISNYFGQYYLFKPMSHVEMLLRFLANFSMFQYFFGEINMDPVYWSLTIELVFYMLILGLFVTNSLKNIKLFGSLFVCFSFLYSTDTWHSFYLVQKVVFFIPIITYFPLFFTGILVYKTKMKNDSKLNYLLILLCLIVQSLLYCHTMASMHLNQMEYIIVLILLYTLLTLFILDKLKFIVNKLTLWLGDISYSLYLSHFYIGCAIILPILVNRLKVNYWIALVVAISASLFVATCINKYIEKPAIKFIRNKYKK